MLCNNSPYKEKRREYWLILQPGNYVDKLNVLKENSMSKEISFHCLTNSCLLWGGGIQFSGAWLRINKISFTQGKKCPV